MLEKKAHRRGIFPTRLSNSEGKQNLQTATVVSFRMGLLLKYVLCGAISCPSPAKRETPCVPSEHLAYNFFTFLPERVNCADD